MCEHQLIGGADVCDVDLLPLFCGDVTCLKC